MYAIFMHESSPSFNSNIAILLLWNPFSLPNIYGKFNYFCLNRFYLIPKLSSSIKSIN